MTPTTETKILGSNHYQKSDKTRFIVYAVYLFFFSMSIISSFTSIEKASCIQRKKDYLKNFCEYLTEYAMEINNLKMKKAMKFLTKEQHILYENSKFCYICKKKKSESKSARNEK